MAISIKKTLHREAELQRRDLQFNGLRGNKAVKLIQEAATSLLKGNPVVAYECCELALDELANG